MTTALEVGEGPGSRPGRSLLPGKTRYPLYRRLGGPQGRPGQVRKTSPPTEIRSSDRPARNQSLYRLSYRPTIRRSNCIKLQCCRLLHITTKLDLTSTRRLPTLKFYWDWRFMKGEEENCAIRNFKAGAFHRIMLRYSNQEGRKGPLTYSAWDKEYTQGLGCTHPSHVLCLRSDCHQIT